MAISLRESVRKRSFSGPYSVPMRENKEQNNSEYGHFLRTDLPLNGITKFEARKIYVNAILSVQFY